MEEYPGELSAGDSKPPRISKRLRFEILRRDDHTCRYCGLRAPAVELTVDHVKPTALGGGNDPENLVTACRPCNSGKSSIAPDAPLVSDVAADALRWARAISFVVDVLEEDLENRRLMIDQFDAAWSVWSWTVRGEQRPLPRDDNWPASIVRLHSLGLTASILEDLVDVAMRKNLGAGTWKYFCGCCWRTLDQIHEDAMDLLSTVEDPAAAVESPDQSVPF